MVCSTACGDNRQDAEQKNLISSVYSSVDEATKRELNRLFVEEGVVPSCKPGCFHCCGQHILTNIAEAQTLTQYIKKEFSPDQVKDLRIRTQQWHEWDKTRAIQPHTAHKNKKTPFHADHHCPMLVEGECSAYTVRPLVCRRHFVCSDPPACRPRYDPESIEDVPVALLSVIAASNQVSMKIKDFIENAGLNFYGSIMLLPHWLAIEMNWNFTISP